MHYFIDGYNLLFRLVSSKSSLEKQRKQVLVLLNDEISSLSLNATIVFDSSERGRPESVRGHFDALEMVFTTKEQTADAYIVKEIENSPHPQQEVVVTSDRELANRCRQLGSKAQSIEDFLAWLLKKKKQKKKRQTTRIFKDSDRELMRLLEIFEKRFREGEEP